MHDAVLENRQLGGLGFDAEEFEALGQSPHAYPQPGNVASNFDGNKSTSLYVNGFVNGPSQANQALANATGQPLHFIPNSAAALTDEGSNRLLNSFRRLSGSERENLQDQDTIDRAKAIIVHEVVDHGNM